jgi:2-amino-4-hydroxy-6-hydroxymethyldihydropteridine diphosphokinase
MGVALLSLGSNLEPRRHLAAAAAALRQRFPGVRFSPVYRVPAVGFDGPDFLNAGAVLETDLQPAALDAWLHALEDAQGRRRDVPRFSSRTLDIDLVFYDDCVLQGPGNLQLPRPELKHAFVLKPLADLVPEFVDPVSGRSLSALWRAHAEHAAPPVAHELVL